MPHWTGLDLSIPNEKTDCEITWIEDRFENYVVCFYGRSEGGVVLK